MPQTPTRIIWTGRRKPAPPVETSGISPTAGNTLPVQPGGKVCEKCGVYVVLPDVHDRHHRRLSRFIDLVHEVFQRRGYITTAGDIPTDGNREGNGHE
ncbi:hypothetical protein C5E45_32865 [Nocardia nova]|uniref:Uncharacterized protein n=1 Tax=Nocardia nova TaxID=37330 RepID=A0A2S6ACR4_9NOCA|nr:hypothetical protein C5E45_32865 [Nocardia nova]